MGSPELHRAHRGHRYRQSRGDRVLCDLGLCHSLFVAEADGQCRPALRHRPIFPALPGLLAVAFGGPRGPRRRRAPPRQCAGGRRQCDDAPAVPRHRQRPRHLLDAADRADLLRPVRRALHHRTAPEDEIHLLDLRNLLEFRTRLVRASTAASSSLSSFPSPWPSCSGG